MKMKKVLYIVLLSLLSSGAVFAANVNGLTVVEAVVDTLALERPSEQKKESWFKKLKRERQQKRELEKSGQVEIKVEREAVRVDTREQVVATPVVESKVVVLDTTIKPEPKPVSRAEFVADSISDLKDRLKLRSITATKLNNKSIVLDTLRTENEDINVLLYSDNTWAYINNRETIKDSLIFVKYWSTTNLTPYRDVDHSAMPFTVVIDLVDSLKSFHYPYMGKVHPRGKFGPRRGRSHLGVDLPLQMGAPIYATFCGRVRISSYNRGGYGNLVIIRHDNGLETYYGHLSERMVEPNQWVEAGQIIGLGGSTGRSTGPHLHFEIRYYGRAFDPQRLIDFEKGILCRETFLLKKNYFSVYSKAPQNFEDEILNEQEDKAEVAEMTARRYHKIRSGDTLGHIAVKHGTTISKICALNGITRNTTLKLNRTLRVR